MGEVAIKRKLTDTLHEYETKVKAVTEQCAAFKKAGADLEYACTIGGTYSRVRLDIGSVYESTMKESLLKSAWYNLYQYLQIERIATANDKKIFEHSMANPPEFTLDNIRASFGDYILDPYANICRGLAEVFCSLDDFYKSHDRVKIGVQGLPKRIILHNVASGYGWGRDRLTDVLNALAAYQGKPLCDYSEVSDLIKDGDTMLKERTVKNYQGKEVTYPARGVWLKTFKNGNGHLFFEPQELKDINRALADYYGDVLADCYEAKAEKKEASTAVSKDLQYYPTPVDVVKRVMADMYRVDGKTVLEPSCGCGRFLDALKAEGATVVGIEVDAGRAQQCRNKGHYVQTANFLEVIPQAKYDFVVMNPPFAGTHYAKHVEHAKKFLKPDGVLYAILPATARYDHGLVSGDWYDLPFGSFKESGTNINTSVVRIKNYFP